MPDERIALKILDGRLGTVYPLPAYATAGSAGVDLRAMTDADFTLAPDDVRLVPAGFAIHIQNPELCALIMPRSGLGTRAGLVLANLTGVIDSDYQGPIMMPLWNRSTVPCAVKAGERVAQMLFIPVKHAAFTLCSSFAPSTRGENGFGSTGSTS